MDTPGGEFLPLPTPDPPVAEELFRRLVLLRVHQAERLSEAFLDSLLHRDPLAAQGDVGRRVLAARPDRGHRGATHQQWIVVGVLQVDELFGQDLAPSHFRRPGEQVFELPQLGLVLDLQFLDSVG